MSALEPSEIAAGSLHLRPWLPQDAGAVTAACQDAELQRWTTVPVPYRREHAVAFVERTAPQMWAQGTGASFAVLDATTEELLACVSLTGLADDRAEIGFWAAAPARGRGVTTEAAAAVCRWGFSALGLPRVTWFAHVGNDASRRVAEKVGFRYEGTLRRYLAQRGERRDAWVAGLLPGDLLG